MTVDIAHVRAQFPSLSLTDGGKARVYLDGPAGTQVPTQVVDAVSKCLIENNANLGGDFPTSQGAQDIVDAARLALADLLGAPGKETVVLGPHMSGLTKQMAATIGKTLSPGDSIVLSRMDHDANVSPWLDMARDHDLVVKWLDLDPNTFMLNLEPLQGYLEDGAKLVAVGYASNVLGTINPVTEICALARQYGALSYIDAVHYAPHGIIDVTKLDCDMLVCSVYKFFGPHCAGLYIRDALIDVLPAAPLRPAPQTGPGRFESGTMNHEGLAGSIAAIDYLASLAEQAGPKRRSKLETAFVAISSYEQALCWQLIDGLQAIDGVSIHGITDKTQAHWRAPTVSFTHTAHHPSEIAQTLTRENIFCWAGHSYAIEPLGRLGLLDSGGVLRLGIAHYNTAEEIAATLAVLKSALA